MSRAFVNEDALGQDDLDLPDRVVSPYPNRVTQEGFAAIEAELARLERELAATPGDDRGRLAQIRRDLRYWQSRRASAEVVPPAAPSEIVRFGSTVVIERDGRGRQSFRIVGEDEADPALGTLSHASPLARALIGKEEGDELRLGDSDIRIVAVS